ncbi:Ferric/cupric reductase transmembrane component 2 [Wickerhamomyces ciferrii]|uniref:Ferric/cupric reductase transmembrane component 2 n=1 Tax=Wickerhamomyces ciferrii (strain ATCC 14091 / BCRC 22168 / CBS 111 / JCM 3599 / NBRC 0793 / NRRL Y-1031 F-60-10) TaxID=1206466 RepID=K0KKN9_WICCF|nr:Ferric/cupric reductase transmembrane component 2 [Wickerhamomyces ciferrii]CCH41683.1 Ferric/cupric reductase transmembrane component 2 [Wickerhamomyces ciferrii]
MRFRHITPVILGSILIFSGVSQGLVIIDSILATQCIYYLKDFDWGCGTKGQSHAAYMCRCPNIDWVGSVTNCIESQSDDRGYKDHALAHVRTRCSQKAMIDYPVDVLKAYQQNATKYIQEPTEYDFDHTLHHPISVNSTSFEFYRRSFNHIYAQVIRSQAYQWGYIFFWTFVIMLGTILNFSKHFLISYANGSKSKFTNNFINKLRYKLTVPNLIHKSQIRILGWPIQIPTTLQSFVISMFIIYMILATTTGYSIDLPNEYQKTRLNQIQDLIGYRTAFGAFALMPPTFLFGIRNNPFIKLTGSSISTFLTYHKWCARGLVLQGFIHSVVWTDYAIREGGYAMWAMDDYWIWGIVGTIVTVLMLFQSSNLFRELSYEFFLLVHKTFGILLIISMWYHCNTLGWMAWLYTCIVIWGYDRILRFLSILWTGGVKKAKITSLNERLVRIVIPKPFGPNDYYFPGCFYCIYFLNFKLRFWQSHPFSVMKSKRSNEEDCYAIVFKTHKGITGKIQKLLLENAKKSLVVDIMTEGPYGHHIPLRQHDQYVFVTGGVGFSPCYSQAIDIIEKDQFRNQSKIIKFIWVVENLEYFEIFKPDMEYLIQHGVDLQIIITNTNKLGKEDSPDYTSIELEEKPSDELYKIIELNARPKISDIVNQIDLSISTNFITSGPRGFIDDMRSSVSELIKDSKVRIDYHEESFSM